MFLILGHSLVILVKVMQILNEIGYLAQDYEIKIKRNSFSFCKHVRRI